MISRSVGRRARLLFLLRMAARSIPMIGLDRSSLSRRTVLFLSILIGAPLTARSASLDDSAREFARKVAASLPSSEGVSVEVRNNSPLSQDEFARLDQTFRDELAEAKVHVAGTGAAVNLRITLSENIKGLLLSAEISQGDMSQVFLMPVSRTTEFRVASYSMPIVLQSKMIWAGPEQILDAAISFGAGGPARLVLLLPDGLEIQDAAESGMRVVKIPGAGSASRDPRGRLEIGGNTALAVLPPRACNVNLDSLQLVECHIAAGREESVTELPPNEIPSSQNSTETESPENSCGAALATGSDDYTQPDWVQAFSLKHPGLAISNKLNFPGPVMALHRGLRESRAIVRNLKTGNYEAYVLSCEK